MGARCGSPPPSAITASGSPASSSSTGVLSRGVGIGRSRAASLRTALMWRPSRRPSDSGTHPRRAPCSRGTRAWRRIWCGGRWFTSAARPSTSSRRRRHRPRRASRRRPVASPPQGARTPRIHRAHSQGARAPPRVPPRGRAHTAPPEATVARRLRRCPALSRTRSRPPACQLLSCSAHRCSRRRPQMTISSSASPMARSGWAATCPLRRRGWLAERRDRPAP